MQVRGRHGGDASVKPARRQLANGDLTLTPSDQLYPFPAVLGGDPDAPGGLDDMALALILCVVDPGIGGVLVRGEKGTAKSTLVRALTQILPPIDVDRR